MDKNDFPTMVPANFGGAYTIITNNKDLNKNKTANFDEFTQHSPN